MRSVDFRRHNEYVDDDGSEHRSLQALEWSYLRTLHLSFAEFHCGLFIIPFIDLVLGSHDVPLHGPQDVIPIFLTIVERELNLETRTCYPR